MTGGFSEIFDGCKKDELTGLLDQRSFFRLFDQILCERCHGAKSSGVVYFDVQRFKVVNQMFGMAEGDRLLVYIAERLKALVKERGFACRMSGDRFAFYMEAERDELGKCVDRLFDEIAAYGLPFEILCNAGISMIEDDPGNMGDVIDRAIIALKQVKGSYTRRYHYYTDSLKQSLLGEQEIVGQMGRALEEKQFCIYFQPQYNHVTGQLVGAEALVRWQHPTKGLILPGSYIPVFENTGFIVQLDAYVFEQVCVFARKCLDEGIPLVSLSVNLTRYDIFSPGYIEKLEEVRKKYDVPVKYLTVEITESSALGNSDSINAAIQQLHEFGYVVEMDDFGSGYSSLNILKDIDFDCIKLDMRFLEGGSGKDSRGGTILSSIVRMLNWLQMPMIAEGVETKEQADFLRSIGCEIIQGYLYSRPIPEAEFEELLKHDQVGHIVSPVKMLDTMNVDCFWSENSLETLIFSNYVGAAVVFEYKNGVPELLRVNQKYRQEIGMNLSEKEVMGQNCLSLMDEENQRIYRDMLQRAIDTGEEQECETWRKVYSDCCGEDMICVRTNVRLLGRNRDDFVFYALIRNVTAEKVREDRILDSERRFKMASEQVNIYYWEYTVATHEMRPCFRCMRDLGLPALLKNYPESAIEMGVFPPEVADMYRDWHKKIAEGTPYLEAVMPLTMDRIPFHVRYTTEFDETGHPVKAYGSAALVVD